MENVIIETTKEYDLKSKKNLESPNNKTSNKSAQNSTVNKPKVTKQKDKTMVVFLIKIKRKALKTMKNRVQILVAFTPQLVLPLKQF